VEHEQEQVIFAVDPQATASNERYVIEIEWSSGFFHGNLPSMSVRGRMLREIGKRDVELGG
jgi:hypothetical protein